MANRPATTPAAVPARNAARRPCRRAIAPAGRMHTAMPTTNTEMGRVASIGEGASWLPMIAPAA